MKRRYLLSALLIILGVGLIAYPSIQSVVQQKMQDRLLAKAEEAIYSNDTTDNQESSASDLQTSTDFNTETKDAIEKEAATDEDGNLDRVTSSNEDTWMLDDFPIDGILYIDKIDLEMPIITGATTDHLKISPSSIEGTNQPSQGGNYAIAGHRRLQYGRQFNRLDEIEVGDEIRFVDANGITYNYTVNGIKEVQETDLSVLESQEGVNEITLITCDPIGYTHPDTRLVITGIEEDGLSAMSKS